LLGERKDGSVPVWRKMQAREILKHGGTVRKGMMWEEKFTSGPLTDHLMDPPPAVQRGKSEGVRGGERMRKWKRGRGGVNGKVARPCFHHYGGEESQSGVLNFQIRRWGSAEGGNGYAK